MLEGVGGSVRVNFAAAGAATAHDSMQVTTSTTGYEEEAQGAATGHEEAQATAIDQEKKPPATGAGVVCPPRDRSRSPRGAPDPLHRQIAEIMIIIIIIIITVVFLILVALSLPLTLVWIIYGSEFLKKSLKKQSH